MSDAPSIHSGMADPRISPTAPRRRKAKAPGCPGACRGGKDAKTVKHVGVTQRLSRVAATVRSGRVQRSDGFGTVDARGDVCEAITRRRITQQDRDKAVALFRDGAYVKDIAASLRITRASTRKILYDAGLSAPPRRMSEPEIREAVRRYESGDSLVRLSERFGYSPGTIRTKLVRAGVEMRPTSVPRPLRTS